MISPCAIACTQLPKSDGDNGIALIAVANWGSRGKTARSICVRDGLQIVRPAIEPDASAASYVFAAAALVGGRATVAGLGEGSLQGDLAFVDVLEQMGAQVERGAASTSVTGVGALRGVEVDMSQLSDTAPTLAVVAAFAEGPTRMTGIGFIRGKETDRVGNVVAELRRLGVEADEEPDGLTIRPGGGPLRPATIQTYDDHRMAMSFAVAGTRSWGITIRDVECVNKTYPEFFEDLKRLRQ